nr:MAG TPA: hypothetical protein [Caudoviricetes sp.]
MYKRKIRLGKSKRDVSGRFFVGCRFFSVLVNYILQLT